MTRTEFWRSEILKHCAIDGDTITRKLNKDLGREDLQALQIRFSDKELMVMIAPEEVDAEAKYNYWADHCTEAILTETTLSWFEETHGSVNSRDRATNERTDDYVDVAKKSIRTRLLEDVVEVREDIYYEMNFDTLDND